MGRPRKPDLSNAKVNFTAEDMYQQLLNPAPGLDLEAMIRGIVDKTGGLDAFCGYVAAVIKSDKSAVAKTRMMAMLADLTRIYSDLKLKNAPNMEDMNTDDLQRMVQRFMRDTSGLQDLLYACGFVANMEARTLTGPNGQVFSPVSEMA